MIEDFLETTLIHRIGFWLEMNFPRIWARTYARYYCPRPIGDARIAKQCVAAGYCGCDNLRRSVIFKARPSKEKVDFKELREKIMKRFAKTLAYLAKH